MQLHRHMQMHALQALMVVATTSFAACGPGFIPPEGLERCPSIRENVVVGGEMTTIEGPVSVVMSENQGRVSLAITPADDANEHIAEFDLAGADIDALVGVVTADAGRVFAGEGDEYGYLRLSDERGVWFEGGRTTSIDGNAQGGANVDGPFLLGDDTGDACRIDSLSSSGVAIHNVLATLSDSSEAVLLDAAGKDGIWRGVDVRAVGVHAHQGIYDEPSDTADGLGPGPHEMIEVVGYLYRRLP